jgi:hypothetical protein
MVTLTGTAPPVLGIALNPANGLAFIADLGNQSVFKWDPASNATKLVAFLGAGAAPNAICFDGFGNVYISDSFNGAIWRTDKNGNNLTQWLPSNPLLIPASGLNPPFGANGIEFNNEHTAMFVANTANRTIIKVPVNGNGTAGTPALFTTGINAPDGIAQSIRSGVGVTYRALNNNEWKAATVLGGATIEALLHWRLGQPKPTPAEIATAVSNLRTKNPKFRAPDPWTIGTWAILFQ